MLLLLAQSIKPYPRETVSFVSPPQNSLLPLGPVNNNLLLTECEGCTERSEVRTKTTEGQYSPVRLELARLVSSLLYGTRLMLYIFLLNALPVS